jgi:hypothetical protein
LLDSLSQYCPLHLTISFECNLYKKVLPEKIYKVKR